MSCVVIMVTGSTFLVMVLGSISRTGWLVSVTSCWSSTGTFEWFYVAHRSFWWVKPFIIHLREFRFWWLTYTSFPQFVVNSWCSFTLICHLFRVFVKPVSNSQSKLFTELNIIFLVFVSLDGSSDGLHTGIAYLCSPQLNTKLNLNGFVTMVKAFFIDNEKKYTWACSLGSSWD